MFEFNFKSRLFKRKINTKGNMEDSMPNFWTQFVKKYVKEISSILETMCGTLCLQYKINEFLWDLKNGNIKWEDVKLKENPPMHLNFI